MQDPEKDQKKKIACLQTECARPKQGVLTRDQDWG